MESKVKCLVWDLDNTIWDGVLVEDKAISIRQEVLHVIKTLDERGILQSISSKNNFELAICKLKEFGIEDYFLFPQISWDPKSKGISEIQRNLNIGVESIAFVDDQVFERDEVQFYLPEVVCIDAADIGSILEMDVFNPRHLTSDSINRRDLYKNDILRNNAKNKYTGTEEEFLRSLDMMLRIDKVGENDLIRAEELTIRTQQLNATGYTYSYEELEAFSKDDTYLELIAQLNDKYGDSGKIGLILIKKSSAVWTIKLLITSCRVISRGIGTILLDYIVNAAKCANVRLEAEFVPSKKNRIMYMTLKLSGFSKNSEKDGVETLVANYEKMKKLPDYVHIVNNCETMKKNSMSSKTQ